MRAGGLVVIALLSFLPPGVVDAYIPYRPIPFYGGQLAVGDILVATGSVQGDIFAHTVILLVAHGSGGDVGLFINRPTRYPVRDVYPGFSMAGKAGDLFLGGPVDKAMLSVLVRSKGAVPGAREVLPHIYHAFVRGNAGADRYFPPRTEAARCYSGYAGWGKDQLANEIKRGDWHVVGGDPALVFDDDPGMIWQELIDRLERGAGTRQ